MNPQAPKLHRDGTIARQLAEYIVDARPDYEFRWSELKNFYDERSDGKPYHSSLTVGRLLKKWATRVRHGVYVAKWLKCACGENLIPNFGTDKLQHSDSEVLH